MFETQKIDLKDLLEKTHKGHLQLPDFQRNYIWDDNDVRSLIASIAKGFPVGALLTLQAGGEVQFKPRLLTGVPKQETSPQEFLLDGQQRVTSLYQALYSEEPVRTRTASGKEVERHYYLDIKKMLNGGERIENAIESMPSTKIRSKSAYSEKLDLSKQEYEFENHFFPLDRAYESHEWIYAWRDYWKNQGDDISSLAFDFQKHVVRQIERYEVPFIRLDKDSSREAICLVYEKLNVGGKSLDTFDLLTAIYAADNYDLREDWYGPDEGSSPGRLERITGEPHQRNVLTRVDSTDFLRANTLMYTRQRRLDREAVFKREGEDYAREDLPAISCSREALLKLPRESYCETADLLEEGFLEAGKFLNDLRIFWRVPYPAQLVVLATIFAILGKSAKSAAAKEKLSHWFWSVTLGKLYGSSVESRLAHDVPELVDWLSGDGGPPQSINEALFQEDRLLLIRSWRSAAYKGLFALMMQSGCLDFITGREADIMTHYDDPIDIHHIFPKRWCRKNRIRHELCESIVNKTPLSDASNRAIGGVAPSAYLKKIEDKHKLSADQLDGILRSHLIEPQHLRNDDFDAFFKARRKKLAGLVEEAMKKPVVWPQGNGKEKPNLGAAAHEEFEQDAY